MIAVRSRYRFRAGALPCLLLLLVAAAALCAGAGGVSAAPAGDAAAAAAAAATALRAEVEALKARVAELEARGEPRDELPFPRTLPPTACCANRIPLPLQTRTTAPFSPTKNRQDAPAAAEPLVPPRGGGGASLQRALAAPPNEWADHFGLTAAVAADARVTAAAGLGLAAASGPGLPGGGGGGSAGGGLPRQVVLGDAAGRLYFFSPDGGLLFEYAAPSGDGGDAGGSAAAVTALAACPPVGNATALAVGRADGAIELLRVVHERASEAGAWRGGGGGAPAPAVHAVSPLLLSTAADRAAEREGGLTGAGASAADGDGGAAAAGATAAISHILCVRAGRHRSVVVAADRGGRVVALPDGGGGGGSAAAVATAALQRDLGGPVLAMRSSEGARAARAPLCFPPRLPRGAVLCFQFCAQCNHASRSDMTTPQTPTHAHATTHFATRSAAPRRRADAAPGRCLAAARRPRRRAAPVRGPRGGRRGARRGRV